MSAAEYLYTSGLISYPRTETTKYPKTVDFKGKKSKLCQVLQICGEEEPMDWETVVESEEVYQRGIDKADHPPIVPTGKPVIRFLSAVQKQVYKLVCQRFFASWMPEQKFVEEVCFLAKYSHFICRFYRLRYFLPLI